ncbi:MAG: 4-diphosphocytidyl-2-C-methyl-D-erythritol kinase [Fusobacteria bacterium]|nr:MAG: 4-diphosphocytidyl-2-C-methyl-D-erythritol kinase [Fusobacteriota bacterium]KAF0228101.1 MAG: 4-diphosphocytidyl-2-C-methyl-D-erythritol [Fusobacteriota bacterium]
MVQVKAYGKINLTLEVLGLRDDSYHEIRSIMQNIELHDILSFESSRDEFIHLSGNNNKLKYDKNNLIYKAAIALKSHTKTAFGANIYLEKNIPIEAGLAGGSADAAATLKGLNNLWKLDLPMAELLVIGARIGSDVPFCLLGDTALVEGRGEKVTDLKSPVMEKLLVVKPDFGASTKLIYQKFDEIFMGNAPNYTDQMIKSIENHGDYKKYLYNDLEMITTKLYPEVQSILDTMGEKCEFVMMSGSGPTCFAFGNDDSINSLYDTFKAKYVDVYITSFKQ